MIKRRDTYNVDVGGVVIGSSNPIRIQSMTNTPTEDAPATVDQIKSLFDTGSELVRVTVNNEKSAKNIKKLPTNIEKVEKKYLPNTPPSLKMPKLTPVFLTNTIFRIGNN